MRQLIIKSPKYGDYTVLVDDEDYNNVSKHKWCLQKAKYGFYAARYDKMVYLFMHRVILNALNGEICDHVDGNGLNNQKDNLRKCTVSENNRNSKIRKHNSANYKGIELQKSGKYHVRITLNKNRISVGTFDTELQAAAAYNRAAIQLHGEFANLNKLPCAE